MEKYLKLISFYNKVFTSNYMSELDLLKLYREFLRDYIRLSKENPSFESDSKWKLYTEGNCYCYALMLPTPKVFVRAYYSKSKHEFPHDVGFLSGKEYSDDIDICYDNLRSDLDFLGVDYYETNNDAYNSHGGYKISFLKSIDDFHFLRQNIDGTWSHKRGYNSYIERTSFDEKIFEDFKHVKTLEIVKPVVR